MQEHIDVILGHNVEYRASASRMRVVVLECSKGGQLEGGARQRGFERSKACFPKV